LELDLTSLREAVHALSETLARANDEKLMGSLVVAVGSRTAKEFSDLDLILLGDEPVEPDVLSDLRYAFAESNLSISVDVLEWSSLSSSFRRVIERTPLEIVQEPTMLTPLPTG
jgi:predicted nucleotidyltransferase